MRSGALGPGKSGNEGSAWRRCDVLITGRTGHLTDLTRCRISGDRWIGTPWKQDDMHDTECPDAEGGRHHTAHFTEQTNPTA